MRITEKQQQKLMNTMNTCGLFVTCGTKPHNVMSTHWGVIGTLWNKQVFVLPVRESKLSHEIIESTKSFAVCMPIKDMRRNSFVRPSVRLQSRQVCRTPSSPEAGAAYRFLRRGRLRIYSRMQSHTFDEYVESQYVGRTFKRYVFPQGLSHYVFRRNS